MHMQMHIRGCTGVYTYTIRLYQDSVRLGFENFSAESVNCLEGEDHPLELVSSVVLFNAV